MKGWISTPKADLIVPVRRTAKVWKGFQLAYTLEGHEQSVWAVLALEGNDDLVLTGELACSPDLGALF